MEVKKTAGSQIDLFIDELQRETGVSDKFLSAARPYIEKAYDVPDDYRDGCFEAIWTTVRQQAETEKIAEHAQEMAKRLDKSQAALNEKIAQVALEIKKSRDSMVAAAVNMCGVLGNPTNTYES